MIGSFFERQAARLLPSYERVSMSQRRTGALALALLLLTACASRVESAPPAGGITIVDSVVLHDASRHRDIPLKIYLPAKAKPSPLLIFSHGLGSSKDGYVYLGAGWAKAGYAVILPTHHGSDRAALQAAPRTGPLVSAAALEDNARDISFIISSLDSIAARMPRMAGRIDRSRIGVAGHSLGGGTALVVAGATLPGRTSTASDSRVRAFAAISPQGTYSSADEHRWDAIRRPVMTIYGSEDRGAEGEPPSWRREPFDRMPRGDKYCLMIDGANHFSFADKPDSMLVGRFVSRGQTRDIAQVHDAVVHATVVFWDAYLKGDAAAKADLRDAASLGVGELGTLTVKN